MVETNDQEVLNSRSQSLANLFLLAMVVTPRYRDMLRLQVLQDANASIVDVVNEVLRIARSVDEYGRPLNAYLVPGPEADLIVPLARYYALGIATKMTVKPEAPVPEQFDASLADIQSLADQGEVVTLGDLREWSQASSQKFPSSVIASVSLVGELLAWVIEAIPRSVAVQHGSPDGRTAAGAALYPAQGESSMQKLLVKHFSLKALAKSGPAGRRLADQIEKFDVEHPDYAGQLAHWLCSLFRTFIEFPAAFPKIANDKELKLIRERSLFADGQLVTQLPSLTALPSRQNSI